MSATWFKDNIPVPDCEDFAYTVGDNGKFSLSIVDPFSADSGNYSCKVVNTFGEAVSHGQLVIKGSKLSMCYYIMINVHYIHAL